MTLQIYNTLHNRKETFQPLDPDRVTLYVCGPTVYNFVHIGNGRPAVVFDVLFRLLRATYPQVRYARNITDIDDKIYAAARANGEPIAAVTGRFTDAYLEDVSRLGVLLPTVQPRATEHVAEMIEIIESLIEREHAYAADGHVLFHVPSAPEYGCLSNRSLEDMIDGARVEVAPYKRDPKDFVLWKPSTGDLPGWDSPWGFGRPGWHIECTAMIAKHLGKTIDIHAGGSDLTFPHHENEIAQGTCMCDDNAFVRYWMHNGMINFGTEKMSKSLGNIVTIRDLLAQHHGQVLRYALLSGHYRQSLTWNDDLLAQSRASLERLYRAVGSIEDDSLGDASAFDGEPIAAFPSAVTDALCDDLNTPEALAALHGIAGEINRAGDLAERRSLRRSLLGGGWLLGLLGEPAEVFFRGEVDADRVDSLVAERARARSERDFERADAIRGELTALGIEIEDGPDGTRWRAMARQR